MTRPPEARSDLIPLQRLAAIALGHVERRYPHKLDHVLTEAPATPLAPDALHPVFHGSFDWHSSVHAYWSLATILRLEPHGDAAPVIRRLFDARLTSEALGVELGYLQRPENTGFERPYGWAWLLMLDAELHRHSGPASEPWRSAIRPLGRLLADRLARHVTRSPYPVRHGAHGNTGFALVLATEHADQHRDARLRQSLEAAARRWYGADEACQAWEPGGDEFLSPCLIEAEAMRGLLPAAEFDAWLARFLPELGQQRPASLFTPAEVADRSDGKMVHLDGLNLSRAWCFRRLAATAAAPSTTRAAARAAACAGVLAAAAAQHLAVALPHVAGDYMGEHWLASFALLALRDGRQTTM